MTGEWNHKVFGVKTGDFSAAALDIFRFQARENPVYQSYLQALKVDPATVRTLEQIPFLPVRFFRTHAVMTTRFTPQVVFESSGTTGSASSRHLVRDAELYEHSFFKGFERVYGPVQDYCILGLLPSYLEREHSSLVYMVQQLIRRSGHPRSGFYLQEMAELSELLGELEARGQRTLLLGVTFALLDFAMAFPQPLRHTLLMETGGMKGRRRELLREEVHARLKEAFQVEAVHSEYGMTELLSQAYAERDGLFSCPPWMRVLVREEEDPLNVRTTGSGAINIIDLANLYSCAFIATDDAGKVYPDGRFEVLGRMDGSDLRGCSLLVL